MPIEYQRDLPADSSEEIIALEEQHVRDHIASLADQGDDPTVLAEQVAVWRARHPENPDLLRIEGFLDAEPDAPYLKPGFDPLAGVNHDLYAAEVEAAVRDEEALRGQE